MPNEYTIELMHAGLADDELAHYGVIGMKWSVRRYQPYSQGYNPQHIGRFQAKKGIGSEKPSQTASCNS